MQREPSYIVFVCRYPAIRENQEDEDTLILSF